MSGPQHSREPTPQPTSPLSPIAEFPPLPPVSPNAARPKEVYGFVAWMGTYVGFIIYLLWAFIPDKWIVATGVTWYPNREWALLVPGYAIIICILTWWTYWALAFAATPSFEELRTMTDHFAHIPKRPEGDAPSPYIALTSPDTIPEVYDLPIGLVNRMQFGRRKRSAHASSSHRPDPATPL